MQWAVLPLDATKCYPRGLYASWNTNSEYAFYYLFYITFSNVPHHFCVVILVLSHSSCSSRKKLGTAAAQWSCMCAVLLVCWSKQKINWRFLTHAKQSPPVPRSTAATSGCVSLLEFVFSMCWPQVVCILFDMSSFPPVCMPSMRLPWTINDRWKLQAILHIIDFTARGVYLHQRCTRVALRVFKVQRKGESKMGTCT